MVYDPLSTVSIDRRHVGQDLGAVETDPVEGRVGEGVPWAQLNAITWTVLRTHDSRTTSE
jgi:hypothetical protein